ncbi:MAG: hypothetical protein GY817_04725 [bacterium]|nr:hypothetical protein [bacterium]
MLEMLLVWLKTPTGIGVVISCFIGITWIIVLKTDTKKDDIAFASILEVLNKIFFYTEKLNVKKLLKEIGTKSKSVA